MLEIYLLLLASLVLISLATGRVGLPNGGWPVWRWFANVMSAHRYWCYGALLRWPPLHRSNAGPFVLARAESGEPFVDQRHLWAQRHLTLGHSVPGHLVPRSSSLSWQSLR